MSPKKQFPTLEQIVESGNASRRSIFAIKRSVVAIFGGSIAPLLLLTPETLPDVAKLGDRGRTTLERGLAEHGLRLRKYEEDIAERATKLYGTIEAVPVQALYVFVTRKKSLGDYRTTQHEPSIVIDTLVRCKPDMTLGELSAMDRQKLRSFLKQCGESVGDTGAPAYDEFVKTIRVRLKVFGLHLGTKPGAKK